MKCLIGKTIIWKKKFRLYCDYGNRPFNIIPKKIKIPKPSFHELKEFGIIWLGNNFVFSFGVDKFELYRNLPKS